MNQDKGSLSPALKCLHPGEHALCLLCISCILPSPTNMLCISCLYPGSGIHPSRRIHCTHLISVHSTLYTDQSVQVSMHPPQSTLFTMRAEQLSSADKNSTTASSWEDVGWMDVRLFPPHFCPPIVFVPAQKLGHSAQFSVKIGPNPCFLVAKQ